MRALLIGFGILLGSLLAEPLGAVERESAQASRERPTSTLEQVSVKPLLLFSMRSRQDPFMAYPLLTTTANTVHFSAANLAFSGLIQVEDAPVALFKDGRGETYTLRGATLYGPDNQRVVGVRGLVSAEKEVSLEQGEKRYVYSAQRTSKRLEDARSR